MLEASQVFPSLSSMGVSASSIPSSSLSPPLSSTAFAAVHHRHRAHHLLRDMDSPANRTLTCPLGGQHGDFMWYFLQSFICLINFSAIVMNLFFMHVCKRGGVMHRNTRLMLSSISFCFATNAAAGLLYNFYFFYLGINSFPKYPVYSSLCSTINALMVPWDVATCLLMVGVGTERLIATRKHVPSGTISNTVKVTFLLAGAAALFVTCNYILNLTKDGMCICDGASLSDRQAMLVRISVCAIVEAGTVALFGYVLILSRSEADGLGINTAKYSLSQRFQIYETYRTTQMLLPSAILHAILYLSYLCLLIPIRDLRAEPALTVLQYNLSTIIFSFPGIHALAHPLICLSRHYYLRQRVDDILRAILVRPPPIVLHSSSPPESVRAATPELSSSQSFRSETVRVDFRVAPERHAQILESFWDRK
ncbi:hypothetical protein WR25_08641 [Diploscapter pachys]|uniref:G-protein coupled receptors family 1 profile domain-containing protein n=1 Tax=Diploscapter pachys TaxID=2018661 RepID=A0A2A2KVQ7_9BILA|nr:hypothetical protein WR25_08641 [Diploscapter pachys]